MEEKRLFRMVYLLTVIGGLTVASNNTNSAMPAVWTQTNITTNPTTPSALSVDCSVDGYFPNQADCSKYYACFNSTLFLKDCPAGQYYNASNVRCVSRWEVLVCYPGSYKVAAQVPLPTPGPAVVSCYGKVPTWGYPHPECKSGYYYKCSNSTHFILDPEDGDKWFHCGESGGVDRCMVDHVCSWCKVCPSIPPAATTTPFIESATTTPFTGSTTHEPSTTRATTWATISTQPQTTTIPSVNLTCVTDGYFPHPILGCEHDVYYQCKGGAVIISLGSEWTRCEQPFPGNPAQMLCSSHKVSFPCEYCSKSCKGITTTEIPVTTTESQTPTTQGQATSIEGKTNAATVAPTVKPAAVVTSNQTGEPGQTHLTIVGTALGILALLVIAIMVVVLRTKMVKLQVTKDKYKQNTGANSDRGNICFESTGQDSLDGLQQGANGRVQFNSTMVSGSGFNMTVMPAGMVQTGANNVHVATQSGNPCTMSANNIIDTNPDEEHIYMELNEPSDERNLPYQDTSLFRNEATLYLKLEEDNSNSYMIPLTS